MSWQIAARRSAALRAMSGIAGFSRRDSGADGGSGHDGSAQRRQRRTHPHSACTRAHARHAAPAHEFFSRAFPDRLLDARVELHIIGVKRLGLHAAAVAPRRPRRSLHALPAALPPLALDAPLSRLRRVRAKDPFSHRPTDIRLCVSHLTPAARAAGSFATTARRTASRATCRRPHRRHSASAIAAPFRWCIQFMWAARGPLAVRAARRRAT